MIHKFKQLGYNIVLDVNSGAVHLPDDCAYDMLDFVDAPMTEEMPADLPAKLPKYFENEVRESYAELYQLYRDGALFAEDDYEKYSDTMVKSPVKSMCLNVSHDCNLRCEYCFAQQGDFGGERFALARDLDAYLAGHIVYSERSAPSARERETERVMLALRTTRGVAADTLPEAARRILRNCEAHGLAHLSGGFYALTPRGFLVSNAILVDLLETMEL